MLNHTRFPTNLNRYDGPAHMAEETQDAANAAPRSILTGFFFMTVAGWVWLVSLLFCITDYL